MPAGPRTRGAWRSVSPGPGPGRRDEPGGEPQSRCGRTAREDSVCKAVGLLLRGVRLCHELRQDLVKRILCAERTPGLLVLDREIDVLLGGAQPLVHVAPRHVEG